MFTLTPSIACRIRGRFIRRVLGLCRQSIAEDQGSSWRRKDGGEVSTLVQLPETCYRIDSMHRMFRGILDDDRKLHGNIPEDSDLTEDVDEWQQEIDDIVASS